MTSKLLASCETPNAGIKWQLFSRGSRAEDPDDDDFNDLETDADEAGELDEDDPDNGEHDFDEFQILDMMVYGDIGMDDYDDSQVSSKQFAMALAATPDAKRINLHINSCGGNAYDAIAIANQLGAHPAKVIAYVDGIAASAASVLAVSADKTVMRQNSFMMIHNAWSFAMGDSKTMMQAANQLNKADSTIADIYAGKTQLDKAEISKMMDAETWMTAQEAKDFGFSDEVRGKSGKPARNSAQNLVVFNSAGFDLSKFRNVPKNFKRLKQVSEISSNNVDKNDVIMNTVEEIKNKAPKLYEEIFALGKAQGTDEAVQAERERITDLDRHDQPECHEIIVKAKADGKKFSDVYDECFAAVSARKTTAPADPNLNRKKDAENVNNLGNDMGEGQARNVTKMQKRQEAADLIAGANGRKLK